MLTEEFLASGSGENRPTLPSIRVWSPGARLYRPLQPLFALPGSP